MGSHIKTEKRRRVVDIYSRTHERTYEYFNRQIVQHKQRKRDALHVLSYCDINTAIPDNTEDDTNDYFFFHYLAIGIVDYAGKCSQGVEFPRVPSAVTLRPVHGLAHDLVTSLKDLTPEK